MCEGDGRVMNENSKLSLNIKTTKCLLQPPSKCQTLTCRDQECLKQLTAIDHSHSGSPHETPAHFCKLQQFFFFFAVRKKIICTCVTDVSGWPTVFFKLADSATLNNLFHSRVNVCLSNGSYRSCLPTSRGTWSESGQ